MAKNTVSTEENTEQVLRRIKVLVHQILPAFFTSANSVFKAFSAQIP